MLRVGYCISAYAVHMHRCKWGAKQLLICTYCTYILRICAEVQIDASNATHVFWVDGWLIDRYGLGWIGLRKKLSGLID